MGLTCTWGPENEDITGWPRSPARAEAGGAGQACKGPHGYEGGKMITQMEASAAAPAISLWQVNSSPYCPKSGEGEGVLLAAGGSPFSPCEVGVMATIDRPDQSQIPTETPARKGNASLTSTGPRVCP